MLNQLPVTAMNPEEEKVGFVEVQLNISGKIYEGLQERIEYSIARVGEKILLGQPVSLLQNNKAAVKTVITNVFTKVLVGFKLESVDLILGSHAKILIHLTPIPPLISNIQINLELLDINPEIKSLVMETTKKIEEELNRIFTGLPVSSVAWSENTFDLVINYLLERDLPGFSSRFSLNPNTVTELNLTLIPEEPLVSSIIINYKTVNIPVLFVKTKTKDYQEKVDVLKGIPVDYLVHYQPKLEKFLTSYLNDFSELQQLGFQVRLRIKPGVKTEINLLTDSQNLQTRLEGRYFINNDQYFGNIQAYLGYHTSEFEIYSRYYWGDNPSGYWKVGAGFPIEPNFTSGIEYEFEHAYKQIWFHYLFERGDYLDLRLGVGDSPNEATIGIYLNKYTNLELVNYWKDFGVQMMFHF